MSYWARNKVIFALFVLFVFAVAPCRAEEYIEGEAIVIYTSEKIGSSGIVKARSVQNSEGLPGVEVIGKFQPVKVQEKTKMNTDVMSTSSDIPETEYNAVYVRSVTGETTKELIERLKNIPGVISATPNYILELDSVEPNDPRWQSQWGPKAINIPDVWTHSAGSEDIVAAIIDSGIMYNHEDLIDNMYVFDEETLQKMADFGVEINPSEFIGSHGAWFHTSPILKTEEGMFQVNVSHPAVPIGPGDGTAGAEDLQTPTINSRYVADITGHGTHVAGIIGAAGNNEIGVTGLNWKVKMLALGCLSVSEKSGTYQETGLLSDLIRALEFAIAAKKSGVNIRVVNISMGYWADEEYLSSHTLVEYLLQELSDEGVILCFAAGNDGQDLDAPGPAAEWDISGDDHTGEVFCPASFKFDTSLTVGALDQNLAKSYFSNYSSAGKWVDIFMPGRNILSTSKKEPIIEMSGNKTNSTGYMQMGGTSMASPMAAGTAALFCAAFPDKTGAEIRQMLINGANKEIAGVGYSAYGMLDARMALPEEMRPIKQEETEEPEETEENNSGRGSSGGCSTGVGAFALLAAIPVIYRKKL